MKRSLPPIQTLARTRRMTAGSMSWRATETTRLCRSSRARLLRSISTSSSICLRSHGWAVVTFLPFEQARQQAEGLRDKHIPSYLIGTPKLGDYLEEGLAQLGVSLEEFELNRL